MLLLILLKGYSPKNKNSVISLVDSVCMLNVNNAHYVDYFLGTLQNGKSW